MQLHNTAPIGTSNGPAYPGEDGFATPRKARIVFVCAGDSSRSLMAEGWANHLGGGWIEARSADTGRHDTTPRALAVMREADVDISQRTPVLLSPEILAWANLIVTICGRDEALTCPVLPPWVRKNHWPLNDPAKATGTDEQIIQAYRATRDIIRTCVTSLIVQRRTRETARR
jgi:arsenate reductase